MSSPAARPRTVTCPSCKGSSRYAPDNPFRPFCSQRCREVDLGAWASEGFRLPVEPGTDADEDPTREPPPTH